jgi:hypothetical protein
MDMADSLDVGGFGNKIYVPQASFVKILQIMALPS